MRRFCLLAAALALLLSACARREARGLRFYYRDAPDRAGYLPCGTADGAIGYERRDLHPATYGELFSLYFAAPLDPALVSPFPKELQCRSVSLRERVLTVSLSGEFDELDGVDRTIAEACLVKTLTQFEGVDGVLIETERTETPSVLYDSDFVLEDIGAVNNETTVRLYFSDSNGRYLVGEERKHCFADESQIPAYILAQLAAGPDEAGLLAVIPEGASLRSVTVDSNGLCTVDFSSEFLLNKPATDLSERMTVLSIVDSLTELPQIKRVRFRVEGEPLGVYYHMDLSLSYERDESAIDAVHPGLNETDATLYVRCWEPSRLVPVPVSVRESSQETLPELLLRQLIAFEPVNDLASPLPAETAVQALTVEDGVCRVDFSRALLACAGDEEAERLAVESVVRTLTGLDEIESVRLSVDGASGGFQYVPLDCEYPLDDGAQPQETAAERKRFT